MSRKNIAKIVLILSLMAGITLCLFIAFGQKVEVSKNEAELQKIIDKFLPYTTEEGDITVQSVKLTMHQSEATMDIAVIGEKFGKSFEGIITATGTPTYELGAVYFKPSEIILDDLSINDQSSIENVPDKKTTLIQSFIKTKKPYQFINALESQFREWLIQVPEVVAIATFNQIPVYKLKNDTKGILVKGSLEELRIKNGNLYIKLTLVQLTWHIIVIILIIIMIVLIIINPITRTFLYTLVEILD